MGRFALCVAFFVGALSLANARAPFMPTADDPSQTCQACLMTVRVLEDVLCDPAATDFLVDFVEKEICPSMGDQEQCHNLAEGLLPTLIQWFRASASPASTCASAGLCGAEVLAVPQLNKASARVKDGAECALCRYVVVRMQAALKDSATLETIKEAALQVCGDLPDELATSCTDFVNEYEGIIAELLEDVDPDTVCGLVGACMEGLVARPPPPVTRNLVSAFITAAASGAPGAAKGGMMGGHPGGPGVVPPGMPHGGPGGMMPTMAGPPPPPMPPVLGLLMALSRPPMMMMPPPPMMNGPGSPFGGPMMFGGPPDNGPCEYCKMAVLEAYTLVSNTEVQAEVLNYTLAVCDSFPSVAEPCKAYVAMYAPLVFTMLEQYLATPDQLCMQAGMCPPPPASLAFTSLDAPTTTRPHCGGPMAAIEDLLRRVGLGAWADAFEWLGAWMHGGDQQPHMMMRAAAVPFVQPAEREEEEEEEQERRERRREEDSDDEDSDDEDSDDEDSDDDDEEDDEEQRERQ